MAQADVETAIIAFLSLGQKLQARQPLTGEYVLKSLTTWYHDTHINEAPLNPAADMLLLQYGTIRQLIVTEPTDLRRRGNGILTFAAQHVRYLDFTRQLYVVGEDEDAEFDDTAVQMSITLGFEAADGSEPHSNLWIRRPADIDKSIDQFLGTPFVQSYIQVPAQSVTIIVDYCG